MELKVQETNVVCLPEAVEKPGMPLVVRWFCNSHRNMWTMA
jgi:hypothetical protein